MTASGLGLATFYKFLFSVFKSNTNTVSNSNTYMWLRLFDWTYCWSQLHLILLNESVNRISKLKNLSFVSQVQSANAWEKADLGDEDRKSKFLRLMGAGKVTNSEIHTNVFCTRLKNLHYNICTHPYFLHKARDSEYASLYRGPAPNHPMEPTTHPRSALMGTPSTQ